ncbi:MAG TPA: hypothetical protein VH280_10470 [Verrucomicrobiae bacterium]|nr:hypothetical protein [Verrucomicrobiae bacterium]
MATAAVGKSVATTFAKKFTGAVVERLSRHRANCFFDAFVDSLHCKPDEINRRLDDILGDDTKSEILFDAYRRVCLSKSKTIGPRIIGLLTGQLTIECRVANPIEESIFEAAESMSDGDFMEFVEDYQELREHKRRIADTGASVSVRWSEENSGYNGTINISPFPWEDALGRWAVKLSIPERAPNHEPYSWDGLSDRPRQAMRIRWLIPRPFQRDSSARQPLAETDDGS